MAKKLDSFPGPGPSMGGQRSYPWHEWTDGGVWEVRRGDDYEIATENMRVNLHMRAGALGGKVRTRLIRDDRGEGLVFQFIESEEAKAMQALATEDPDGTQDAMGQLYRDALEIYERAREEVMIPRSDGTEQSYAAVRYKQQIERGWAEGALVPAVARIVRRRTLGFGHLERARRRDLFLECLVVDPSKPYHRFFSAETVRAAQERLDDYDRRHGG